MVIVIADTSVKNNITTFIVHVHSFNNPLKKIFYQAINTTLTETKLFAIKYEINKMVQIPGFLCITIITDIFHMAQKIFDFSTHLYQL